MAIPIIVNTIITSFLIIAPTNTNLSQGIRGNINILQLIESNYQSTLYVI